MAYISKTGLRPNTVLTNGSDSISFIETPCTYQQTYIQYITEYFNIVTGLFDNTKTMIYFESGESLLINQSYAITSAELIALNP